MLIRGYRIKEMLDLAFPEERQKSSSLFEGVRSLIASTDSNAIEKDRLKPECKPRTGLVDNLPEVSDPAVFFL